MANASFFGRGIGVRFCCCLFGSVWVYNCGDERGAVFIPEGLAVESVGTGGQFNGYGRDVEGEAGIRAE